MEFTDKELVIINRGLARLRDEYNNTIRNTEDEEEIEKLDNMLEEVLFLKRKIRDIRKEIKF